jgi:hypothetical protein
MVAHARPDGAPIALTVYPGVHHNFDVAQLTPGVRHFGHWLEYNEPAAKDGEEKTRAFLATHLAGTAPVRRDRRRGRQRDIHGDHVRDADPLARCSVTIAARTASRGELTRLVCSTANNRRFVLSSIGEDEA